MSAKAIKYTQRALQMFVAVSTFPVSLSQSFVPPQEACLLINPCKHSGVPQCGRDSKDLSTRLFRDDCDMVEHNCYKIQEYYKVDINECNDTNSRISTNKNTSTFVWTIGDDNITDTTLLTTKSLQTTTAKPTKKASINITTTKKSSLTSTPKSSKKPISTTRNLASTISRSALTSQLKNNKSTTHSSTSQKSMTNEPTTIHSTNLDFTTLKSTPLTCQPLTTSKTTPTMALPTLHNIFVYIKNIYMLRGSNVSSPNIVPTILPTPATTSISPNQSTTSSTVFSKNEIKNKSSSTKEKITKNYLTKATKISTKSNSTFTKRNYISSTVSISSNVTETVNETTSKNNSSKTICDGYPNDCKRPQTWETTAKGERDRLRDRFGDKVKYLYDTTHFPKRRVNTADNFLQSFLLGDHNES